MAGKEIVYTIPLRKAFRKARKKRGPYAIKLIEGYLRTHTKSPSIKIGSKLNEAVWARGIQKPPRRVRVKAVVDAGITKAELMGFDYKDFKAAEKTERKGAKEKLLERLGPKALQKEKEEKIAEGKEIPPEEEAKTA